MTLHHVTDHTPHPPTSIIGEVWLSLIRHVSRVIGDARVHVDFLINKGGVGWNPVLSPDSNFLAVGMASSRVLVLLLLRLCWFSVRALDEVTTAAANGTTAHSSTASNNTQAATKSSGPGVRIRGLNVDSSMIQRALYVLIGITMTGVLYFLIRAVR